MLASAEPFDDPGRQAATEQVGEAIEFHNSSGMTGHRHRLIYYWTINDSGR